MKIVYYNWVDHDDIQKRGGGVSIYQKNVASSLGHDKVYYISSGVYYDPFDRTPRLIRKRNKFYIQNSAALAPSHFSFSARAQLSDDQTSKIFIEALTHIGNPNIIHFNNLEGIPVSILPEIKKEFPNTKIVFSVHNYYAFCPQVNLWNREKRHCDEFNGGKACINCISEHPYPESIRKAYSLSEKLHNIGIKEDTKTFSRIWQTAVTSNTVFNKFKKIILPEKKTCQDYINFSQNYDYFTERRPIFVNTINKYCDIILPVSERVREICLQYGLEDQLLHTCYIGTDHAKYFNTNHRNNRKVRSIGYYGYMRRDKGFYFFLKVLKRIPDDLAKHMSVIIAAKNTDHHAFVQIRDLTQKFDNVIFADGYNAASQEKLLAMTDLVVIPPLWEDNLPQVAIEANCHNVPLFCSDKGGGCRDYRQESVIYLSGRLNK
ncbi:glycosyltransferase [Pseudochrobactrum sp. HB0163]|uniref:glycosyltransferase n=1 Tax=Pseudochrobactrum sp. HB0163 TaxID=3450708 RepID=UPI003F6DDA63